MGDYFVMLKAMVKNRTLTWFPGLLNNSRFWILAAGIVLSVNIAGLVQFLIPNGSLQMIRIEQAYGFVSIFLLFVAMLASPLTKAFPNAPYNNFYLHARRAIGVLAFYYAALHVGVSFFAQLGGFAGIKYYSAEYRLSIVLGVIALSVLFVMAATSLDWVVKFMTYPRWKLLHRLVYMAGIAVLAHVVLIGSHYADINLLSALTIVAVLVLLRFEQQRIRNFIASKRRKS